MNRKNIILVISLVSLLSGPSLFAMQQVEGSDGALTQRMQSGNIEPGVEDLEGPVDTMVSGYKSEINKCVFSVVADGKGNLKALLMFIEKGADPNKPFGELGFTPFHFALLNKTITSEVVSTLIDKGADPNKSGWLGDTPLHCALRSGTISPEEVISTLIDKGADPNKSGWHGFTPLHYALLNGTISPEVISTLIDKGADPNKARSGSGSTPLHFALRIGTISPEILQALINGGADIDAKDNQGRTPLHFAIFNGNTGVVEMLLSKGAKFDVADRKDLECFEFAQEQAYAEIVGALRAVSNPWVANKKPTVRGLLNLIMKPLRSAKENSASIFSSLVGRLQRNNFASRIVNWFWLVLGKK